MADVEGRYTGVLTPTGDHHMVAHTTEKDLDAIDLAALDDLYARLREQVPALGPIILDGRHYGRAVGPDGDSQLYVVSDEPLSDEQRAILDAFTETGEWPWLKGKGENS